MIHAMIFDLDGTLLQTERLKAISYAKAAVELCPYSITEDQVMEVFKEFVGLSRREVAMGLVERFNLTQKASGRMGEFGVSTPWQAYVQVRLNIYNAILDDPDVIRNNQWSHNVTLLELARGHSCKTALATMSHCEQVSNILDILAWCGHFDFVATRDDVLHGKPDPEIYLLVAQELDVLPENCLVIEDSATGVQAALNAGMKVVAVSTDFTHDKLHALEALDSQWIVDDPKNVLDVVQKRLSLS